MPESHKSVRKKVSVKNLKEHKDKDHKDKDHKDKEHKDKDHKEHTKKRSKDTKEKSDEKKKNKDSVRAKVSKQQQVSEGPDETEDHLDDNQNLIQITPQAATPNPHQSMKRRDSSKGKTDKHTSEPAPQQSQTSRDTTMKKKKKKDKAMENFTSLAKSIEAKTVEEMCNEFKVNHKPGCEELNRDTRYVLSFNVPPDSDFYDASKVEMPGIDCKFIAAAAPGHDNLSMETFWRLVYDANVANIFYLEPAGNDFSQLAHFLPLEPAGSKDYGKMFINNKKVERNPKEFQAVVEVLPEGCSNSIIVRFIQGRQWPDYVARKYRRIALHLVRTLKNEKSTSLIVCKDGRGHCGQFILLHSVISEAVATGPDFKLKMPESLASLRHARWGAIQTEQQYLLMYMLSLDFLACKSKGFEPQARNLERAILDYLKKQKEASKAATPKETKAVTEKPEKLEIAKEKDDKKEEKKEEKKEKKKEDKKADHAEPSKMAEAATQFGQPGKEHEKEPIQAVHSLYL